MAALRLLVVIILLSAAIALFWFYPAPYQMSYVGFSTVALAICLFIEALVLLYLFIVYFKKIFSYLFRHPRISLPSAALLAILIIGGIYFYHQYQYRSAVKNLSVIQDSLAEAEAAKIMGDSIVAKKPIPDASAIRVKVMAKLVSNRLGDLPSTKLLDDYRKSIVDWANSIATAADDANLKTWKNVSNKPADFKIKLTNKQANDLFLASINKIKSLKEFGDSAIKRKDSASMVYIAAKLLVQEHWLSGIQRSEKAGLLGKNFANQALAAFEDVPPVGRGEDVTCQVCADPNVHWTAQQRQQYGCDTRCKPSQNQQNQNQQQNQQTQGQTGQNQGGKQTGNSTNNQNNFKNNQPNTNANQQNPPAGDYGTPKRQICIGTGGSHTRVSGGPDTGVYCVEEAIQTVNEIESLAVGLAVNKNSAYSEWDGKWHDLEGLGVISTDSSQTNSSGHSPTVQAFYDSCGAKGGIVGGTGMVKDRLPTTEGGYTCEYKTDTPRNGMQKCWDFLTYSGGRYLGGNSGCPEQDIMPQVLENTKSAVNEMDGTYHYSSNTTCSGDLTGIPLSGSFTVSKGIASVPSVGVTFPIYSNGDAVTSYQQSVSGEGGYMTASAVVYLHFSKQGGTYKVSFSGTMVGSGVSSDGRALSGNCTGSGGGSK
jgi:hypothetical protein